MGRGAWFSHAFSFCVPDRWAGFCIPSSESTPSSGVVNAGLSRAHTIFNGSHSRSGRFSGLQYPFHTLHSVKNHLSPTSWPLSGDDHLKLFPSRIGRAGFVHKNLGLHWQHLFLCPSTQVPSFSPLTSLSLLVLFLLAEWFLHHQPVAAHVMDSFVWPLLRLVKWSTLQLPTLKGPGLWKQNHVISNKQRSPN